jgi:hypothetical protein
MGMFCHWMIDNFATFGRLTVRFAQYSLMLNEAKKPIYKTSNCVHSESGRGGMSDQTLSAAKVGICTRARIGLRSPAHRRPLQGKIQRIDGEVGRRETQKRRRLLYQPRNR